MYDMACRVMAQKYLCFTGDSTMTKHASVDKHAAICYGTIVLIKLAIAIDTDRRVNASLNVGLTTVTGETMSRTLVVTLCRDILVTSFCLCSSAREMPIVFVLSEGQADNLGGERLVSVDQ